MQRIMTKNLFLMGNFNLDANKEFDQQYSKKALYEDMNNKLGHHNLGNE